MSYNLTKFEANNLSTGVAAFTSDFSPDIRFSMDTKNVTTGIRQGVGPRFGMAPIPGQADTAGAAGSCASIRQSEAASGPQYLNRVKYFGCYYVNLGTAADVSVNRGHFAWVVGKSDHLDVVVGATATSSTNSTIDPEIVSGLPVPNTDWATPTTYGIPAFWEVYGSSYGSGLPGAGIVKTILSVDSSKFWLSSASISTAGKVVKYNYLAGRVTAQPSGTTPPQVNLVDGSLTVPQSMTSLFGIPSSINSGTVSTTPRSVKIHSFDLYQANEYCYQFDGFKNTAVYIPSRTFDYSIANTNFGAADRVQTVRGGSATIQYAVVEDPEMTGSTGYRAILLATGKTAAACIVSDVQMNLDGTPTQWADLTQIFTQVKKTLTRSSADITKFYTEDGTEKSTCWISWPPFVTGTAAKKASARTSSSENASLGEANSGVLRANTTYEFAYSLFNKRTGYESNVGDPAKLRTGTDDYVSAILTHYFGSSDYNQYNSNSMDLGNIIPMNPDFTLVSSVGRGHKCINDIEYRIYYRQLGSFEWIPALFVDAVKWLFFPTVVATGTACNGPIAGSPAGQPGGFNDYSLIPKDQWTSVVSWQGRAFWSSKKSLVFSMRDNVFAYPVRNSVSCPTGEFRGITVHAFPGQAEQRGRLIVWGSDECYIGSFSGDPILQAVQVSATTSGQFPLDGSDFSLERWTTNTAFSHRAAVVAEGELWYWGSKGIFHDNGTDFGDRVSITIEPDIFTLYDPAQSGDIFGHYFAQTKEIYWFYAPRSAPTLTHAIVLNTVSGGIYRAEFGCKIDSAQDISIENTSDTQTNLCGKRVIISVRADSTQTLQRPYFFDMINRSGDLEPGTEALVKQITATGLSAVLTLDAGTSPTVNIGDYLAIHQASDYSGVVIPDMICQVTNVSPLTVSTPIALPNWTAGARKNYFPVWIAPMTQIPYRIKTQYWSPTGMQSWYRFLFSHFQFRVKLWPANAAYNLNLGYRTPISGTLGSKTITLSDNSDGNCQIYAALPGDLQKIEGQGIQHDIAGVHNGSEWVLQYMATHAEAQLDGDNLLTFEG